MNRSVRLAVCAIALGSFALEGCAKLQQAIQKATARPNLTGAVKGSSGGSGGSSKTARASKTRKGAVPSQSASSGGKSGCTVGAYSLIENEKVGEATTDSNGRFTIEDGVENGEKYRLKAECPDPQNPGTLQTFMSVAGADIVPPEAKADETLEVSPRSTVAAALIIQTVLETVNSALAGTVSDEVRAVILAAISRSLDSVISQISASVEESIENGDMEEPSEASASLLAADVASVTDDSIDDLDLSGHGLDSNSLPPAIASAAAAASSGSALKDCDAALEDSSQDKCTAALSALLVDAFKMQIAVRASGGAFGDTSNCTAASFRERFKSRPRFTHVDQLGGFCHVASAIAQVDRNRSMEGDEGSSDNGLVLIEQTDSAGTKGLLSVIAQGLFQKHAYRLGDLDRIVFGHVPPHSGVPSAGINARLFQVRPGSFEGENEGFQEELFYLSETFDWVAVCNSSPCPKHNFMQELFGGFASAGWESAQARSELAESIGRGRPAALGVFERKFGGRIPTIQELDEFLGERIHIPRNPTGPKEFHVLYREMPKVDPEQGSGCWDNDPSTPCVGESGAEYPAVRATVVRGSLDSSEGIKPISEIALGSQGDYLVLPIFQRDGFSGVFQLIHAESGRLLSDELSRRRFFYRIPDQDSSCSSLQRRDDQSLPACSPGKVYNVHADWQCHDGECSLEVRYLGGPAILLSGESAVGMRRNYKNRPIEFESANGEAFSFPALTSGSGDWDRLEFVRVTLSQVSGTSYTINQVLDEPGTSIGASSYYLMPQWSETQPGRWAVTSFVALDQDGTLDFDKVVPAGDVDSKVPGASRVEPIMGPYLNPAHRCSSEPFFVDGNGNGELDCDADDLAASEGDVTFDEPWKFEQQHSGELESMEGHAELLMNRNGYLFKDGGSTKAWLTTAFGGWFDGEHALTGSSELDALQAFTLMMFFFEGQQDGGKMRIGGLGEHDLYKVESPMFYQQDDDSVLMLNRQLAGGFNLFRKGLEEPASTPTLGSGFSPDSSFGSSGRRIVGGSGGSAARFGDPVWVEPTANGGLRMVVSYEQLPSSGPSPAPTPTAPPAQPDWGSATQAQMESYYAAYAAWESQWERGHALLTLDSSGAVLSRTNLAGAPQWIGKGSFVRDSSGSLWMAGTTDGVSGPAEFSIRKLTSTGQPSAGFGAAGKLVPSFSNSSMASNARIAAYEGGIVVASSGMQALELHRYDAQGQLVSAFGDGGKKVHPVPAPEVPEGLEARSPSVYLDSIVAGGSGELLLLGSRSWMLCPPEVASGNEWSGGCDFRQYPFQARVDGESGSLTPLPILGLEEVNALELLPTGKYLVGGKSSGSGEQLDQAAVCRFNPDGTRDLSFGIGGCFKHVPNGATDGVRVNAMKLLPNGRIAVTGEFEQGENEDGDIEKVVLWMLHPDGRPDLSYNASVTPGYSVHHNAAGGNGEDEADFVLLDSEGRLVLVGESEAPESSSYSSEERLAVWRFARP